MDALCKTADRYLTRRIERAAFALTKDATKAAEIAAGAAMEEDERAMIASLTETVCLQYNLAGQHTPAIILGGALLAYGTRVTLAMSELKSIAIERSKVREAQQKAAMAEAVLHKLVEPVPPQAEPPMDHNFTPAPQPSR